MSQQSIRQAAQGSALDAQAVLRKERADRETPTRSSSRHGADRAG
jgi:hypothetical protein